MTPGYFSDVSLKDYLSDKLCDEPSMSKGDANTVITRTPLHAHWAHPKLGNHPSEQSARSDLGSAIHAKLLGGASLAFAPDEFEDWRKKAAQEFRDDARAKGLLPLLARQKSEVEIAAGGAAELLHSLGKWTAEQTLYFKVGETWCRGRTDALTDEYDIDIKSCSDADPATWVRQTVQSQAYDLQAGLRRLGHAALGHPRRMLWLLVEIDAPHACSLVEPSDEMLALAERKIVHAAKIWRQCLDSGKWPGYSRTPVVANPTSGMLWAAEERGVA
jgi:hypothetical protein